tara:strand:- start:198 stop:548 length:351 start_codon:yes stop_codon:yes gene_type:complete
MLPLVKKKLCFDLDGVICTTKGNDYLNAKPKKQVIKFINKLSEQHTIIIFTARYMGRNRDKISLAKKQGYKKTLSQLKKWKLSYDKLVFGKPSYDVFVDDKAYGFKKNWFKKFYIK